MAVALNQSHARKQKPLQSLLEGTLALRFRGSPWSSWCLITLWALTECLGIKSWSPRHQWGFSSAEGALGKAGSDGCRQIGFCVAFFYGTDLTWPGNKAGAEIIIRKDRGRAETGCDGFYMDSKECRGKGHGSLGFHRNSLPRKPLIYTCIWNK